MKQVFNEVCKVFLDAHKVISLYLFFFDKPRPATLNFKV